MVDPVTLEQFTTNLSELIKGWYYIFFPVVIFFFYSINKRLKKMEKRILLISNYVIETIIDEEKNPKDYLCEPQEFVDKKYDSSK